MDLLISVPVLEWVQSQGGPMLRRCGHLFLLLRPESPSLCPAPPTPCLSPPPKNHNAIRFWILRGWSLVLSWSKLMLELRTGSPILSKHPHTDTAVLEWPVLHSTGELIRQSSTSTLHGQDWSKTVTYTLMFFRVI